MLNMVRDPATRTATLKRMAERRLERANIDLALSMNGTRAEFLAAVREINRTRKWMRQLAA